LRKLLIVLFIIVACVSFVVSYLLTENQGEAKREAETQKVISYSSEDKTLEEWVSVGGTLEVEDVVKEEGYRVQVEDKEKGLVWYPIPSSTKIHKSEKDYSYVKRLPNDVERTSFFGSKYKATNSRYELYEK